MNLNNVNRPEQQAPQGAAVPANNARRSSQDHQQNDNEGSELQSNSAESGNETEVLTQNNEPQVPIMEVIKTFLFSFVASIIPSDPAI